MENKVNVAEILKHCPHGMKLNSPAYSNLYFDNVIDSDSYPIKCFTSYNGMLNTVFLTKYGEIRREENAKCVIFPKDKTTWEGFVPPCKFKDGDILYIDCTGVECSYKHNKYIFILKEISDGKIYCYCYIDEVNKYKKFNISWLSDMTYTPRFATEEEKQKLFDAIKENGYKWNAETKTLEKLVEPKFKVGDRIRCKNCVEKYDGFEEGIIDTITDNKYGIVIPHLMGIVTLINITDQDNWELVTLKFKTGDRIRRKIKRRNYIDEGEIKSVSFNFYDVFTTDEKTIFIPIREQDKWELVPDKIKPKFKVGDVIQDNEGYKVEITEVNIGDECYEYISKLLNWKGSISFNDQDKWELVPDKIEPKFKVGDRVKHKQSFISGVITNIGDDCYKIKNDSDAVSFDIIKYQDEWEYECGVTFIFKFSEQDNWELFPEKLVPEKLVPEKFDISTLVPFESRVLVRRKKDEIWRPAIFGCYNGHFYYVLCGIGWKYCIPYEGNENLCGKTDDCDEYYKTW